MKRTALALLLALGFSTSAAVAEDGKPNVLIANGERLHVTEKGFSIVPPTGWEIHTDFPNLTLMMQIPKSSDVEYQRTITVKWGNKPYPIDEMTAEEFAQTIVDERAKTIARVHSYRLRNKMPVTMEDGNKGFLFYTEFKVDEFDMMELHILISAEDGHFLMTYTDFARFFDSETGSPNLDEAYNALMSASVEKPAAGRFEFVTTGGLGFLGLILLWMFIRYFFGHRRVSTIVKESDEFEDGDIVESSTVSGAAPISAVSAISEVSDVKAKKMRKGKKGKAVKKARARRQVDVGAEASLITNQWGSDEPTKSLHGQVDLDDDDGTDEKYAGAGGYDDSLDEDFADDFDDEKVG